MFCPGLGEYMTRLFELTFKLSVSVIVSSSFFCECFYRLRCHVYIGHVFIHSDVIAVWIDQRTEESDGERHGIVMTAAKCLVI